MNLNSGDANPVCLLSIGVHCLPVFGSYLLLLPCVNMGIHDYVMAYHLLTKTEHRGSTASEAAGGGVAVAASQRGVVGIPVLENVCLFIVFLVPTFQSFEVQTQRFKRFQPF